jgi:hypothetical protein
LIVVWRWSSRDFQAGRRLDSLLADNAPIVTKIYVNYKLPRLIFRFSKPGITLEDPNLQGLESIYCMKRVPKQVEAFRE